MMVAKTCGSRLEVLADEQAGAADAAAVQLREEVERERPVHRPRGGEDLACRPAEEVEGTREELVRVRASVHDEVERLPGEGQLDEDGVEGFLTRRQHRLPPPGTPEEPARAVQREGDLERRVGQERGGVRPCVEGRVVEEEGEVVAGRRRLAAAVDERGVDEGLPGAVAAGHAGASPGAGAVWRRAA
ncbi:MAG: hypothetical protein DYH06_06730, partial [Acidobacteria bacterium ACB2]|nr:hypothetical protein [Acidobacteria bacterium ACB2]